MPRSGDGTLTAPSGRHELTCFRRTAAPFAPVRDLFTPEGVPLAGESLLSRPGTVLFGQSPKSVEADGVRKFSHGGLCPGQPIARNFFIDTTCS